MNQHVDGRQFGALERRRVDNQHIENVETVATLEQRRRRTLHPCGGIATAGRDEADDLGHPARVFRADEDIDHDVVTRWQLWLHVLPPLELVRLSRGNVVVKGGIVRVSGTHGIIVGTMCLLAARRGGHATAAAATATAYADYERVCGRRGLLGRRRVG